MTPKLTLCIPTYNRVDYLRRCLESIRGQMTPDLAQQVEILVGDNCSPDTTPAAVAELAPQFRQLRYYRNPANLGAIPNYLKLLQEARGDFIMLLTDDDYLAPKALQSQLDALLAHPDTGYFWSPVVTVDDRNGEVFYVRDDFTTDTAIAPGYASAAAHAETAWVMSRQVYNRRLIDWQVIERNRENPYLPVIVAGRLLVDAGGWYSASRLIMHIYYNKVYWDCFGENELLIRLTTSAGFRSSLGIVLDQRPEFRREILRWEHAQLRHYLKLPDGGYRLMQKYGMRAALRMIDAKYRLRLPSYLYLTAKLVGRQVRMIFKPPQSQP